MKIQNKTLPSPAARRIFQTTCKPFYILIISKKSTFFSRDEKRDECLIWPDSKISYYIEDV
jgi:hypothetical protein